MGVPFKVSIFLLKFLGSLHVFCLLIGPAVAEKTSQVIIDNLGKAAKGRLYSLRSKLTNERIPLMTQEKGGGGSKVKMYLPVHYVSPPPSSNSDRRGYSYHHNSGDIKNPMWQNMGMGYSSRDFHSRMGKISTDGIKWKNPDKTMDKYMKYAYKVEGAGGGAGDTLNSFNIHQLDTPLKNGSSVWKKEKKSTSATMKTTTTTTERSTTLSVLNPFSVGGLSMDIGKIGQGLNSAMTQVLTQKLMGIIDQEIPQGFMTPLKHLVSCGEKMVQFWDKKKEGRDGDSGGRPGIVEMFGYGIEQLKRYKDGQNQIVKEDPVANVTSASKALIQGMMVIKKLTNRVLGYDTEENGAVVESRGGYDHGGGGWGWGHHMSYGGLGGLDPFALLAALAFGAFLLQLLLTILNTSARSIDVVDLNVPLLMSDYHVPNLMTKMDKIFGTPTIRSKRSALDEESSPFFNSVVDKLEGMYRTYKTVTGNPDCGRLYLCRAAIQDAFKGDGEDETSLYSQLYIIGLGQLSKDPDSLTFVKSVRTRVTSGEDVNCEAEFKGCENESSPSL